MEIGNSLLFAQFLYRPPSSPSGLMGSGVGFLAGAEGGRSVASARRVQRCRGEWPHELRPGARAQLCTTDGGLPHALYSPCVAPEFWKSFRLLHFDRIFKQAMRTLKGPNQSVNTICTTSHLCHSDYVCTLTLTHTPPISYTD